MIPACTNVLTGRLQLYTGATAGNRYLQGVRITPTANRAFVTNGGTPVYMVGGAPLDAEGRLCATPAVPSKFGTQGLGYTASGQLAVNLTDAPTHYQNGMAFYNGALCVEIEDILAPPGPFTLSGAANIGINNINWTAPSPAADNFDLFRDGELFKYNIPGNSLGTFDTEIIQGNTYRYAVRARNADGETTPTPPYIDLTAI